MDGDEEYWDKLKIELLLGAARLLDKYDAHLALGKDDRSVKIYLRNADGHLRYAEIRYHDKFCFLAISAVIAAKSSTGAIVRQAGDLVGVLDADASVVDIIKRTEEAAKLALSWDASRLKYVKPPWHRQKRNKRRR